MTTTSGSYGIRRSQKRAIKASPCAIKSDTHSHAERGNENNGQL